MKKLIIMIMVIEEYSTAIQSLIPELDWSEIRDLTFAVTVRYPTMTLAEAVKGWFWFH